jgi:hypothetical protein
MTKKEACQLLSISERTLQRRVAAGIYTCTRIGTGQFAALDFSHSDIGLPEPVIEAAPEPTPTVAVAVAPLPEPVRESAPRELTQAEKDAQFAEAYKAGYACDSYGNTIDDSEPKRSLGYFEPSPPVESNKDYQISKRAPEIGTDGQPIEHGGSDNHPLIARRIANGEFQGGEKKPRHPNQTRQDCLNEIFRDIRRGYSR